MSWQCFMIDEGDYHLRGKPGAMWFAKADDEHVKKVASAEYMRDWYGKRPMLIVCLPNGNSWNLDMPATDRLSTDRGGWTITGEAPNVTASPSINYQGYYHGWLQNGVLSEDVEGRRFPAT